ncbi:MAG: tetratricopeptide repeat protein [Salinivirgaceae bacterium]|nr:tetratricopeptide repeat protein [Salinivirgaceae bacterium]
MSLKPFYNILVLLILSGSGLYSFAADVSNVDSLLNVLKTERNDTVKVNLLNKIGDKLSQDKSDKTLTFLNEALELAKSIGYEYGVCESLLLLGNDALQKGAHDNAIDYLDQSLNQRNKYNIIKNTLKCYIGLGSAYMYNSEYDKSIEVFDTGIKIGVELKDFSLVPHLLKIKGVVLVYTSEYTSSIECFKKAVVYYIKDDNRKGVADCLTNIGVVYNYMGNHILSIEYQKKAIEEYRKIDAKNQLAKGLNNLGVSYDDLNKYEKALECYTEALAIRVNIADELGTSVCYNNIGEVYKDKGEYAKAVEFYEKSLAIDRKLDDEGGIAICLLNIGHIHFLQSSYEKTDQYYTEALVSANKHGDKRIIANILNGIGESYLKQLKLDKALLNFNKAMNLCVQIGEKSEEAKSLYLIGEVYRQKGSFADAIDNFNKAKAIHQELEETGEVSTDNLKIGEAWLNMGYPSKAIDYSLIGLKASREMGIRENIRLAAEILSKAYAKKNNFEEAYQYSNLYRLIHDSLFTLESQKQIHIVEYRFELERKEKEITLQKTELEKQDAVIKHRLILQNALIGGIAAIFIIVILVVLGYIRIHRAKGVIMLQNNEIEEKNEELKQSNEELRVTVETVNEQKERIQKTKKEITDSIEYAQYIQRAILPKKEALAAKLTNFFVFYKPKNIVSGDFYWTTEIEGRTIIAAADCTGHGVPGAFMSMLGVSFLNEIVNKEYITHAGVILQRLRKEVIHALQQKGVLGEQRDGMDIALCSIDFDKLQLQFSGAHNPLYIIRKKETLPVPEVDAVEYEDYILYEIRGDRMPIALYEKMDRFSTKEIQIYKGDQIYMFSDGYVDQFGGTDGKRYKSRTFKELLLKNCSKSMAEQKCALEAAHINWKNDFEQIDDIMVMGLLV